MCEDNILFSDSTSYQKGNKEIEKSILCWIFEVNGSIEYFLTDYIYVVNKDNFRLFSTLFNCILSLKISILLNFF